MSAIRMIAAFAALVVTLQATAPAAAQDWPARPVTMVVPFAAGSGSDILGGHIGRRRSESDVDCLQGKGTR